MDIKDLVRDRLNEIEDLDDRRLLKKVMTGLFVNLVEHNEEMNKNLEERIFNEIDYIKEKFDVYVTLAEKKDVDPVHEFMFPILYEDIEKKYYNISEIYEKINEGEEVYLFRFFMECDNEVIHNLIGEDKIYKGKIVTDSGEYEINALLKQSTVYTDEIEFLYNLFLKNDLPWRTVNNPYGNKFLDVILKKMDKTIDENEIIKEISIDIGEFEKYKKINMVPLWNVKRILTKDKVFPMPANDRLNYDHSIDISKMGIEHGYLINEDDLNIRYMVRKEREIIVVSEKEKAGKWNIVKIASPSFTNLEYFEYEIASNRMKNNFIDRYSFKNGVTIRTMAEISRLINSFETSEEFKLNGIDILDNYIEKQCNANLNPFIYDNIRDDSYKKILLIKLKAKDMNDFIIRDKMNFLISEIQLYFPEYRCLGELV